MLADSLGQHSALFVFPYETKVLPYFLLRSSEFGDLGELPSRRRLALEMGRTKEFWQANGKQNLELRDDELAEPSFGGVVDALFRRLAAPSGKLRWVEKSPQNLGYAGELAAAFPSARFVHIIRDGRDCAQSLHRRWKFDPVVSIYRWRNLVQLGRKAGAAMGSDRYMEIRYEELTSSPSDVLTRVCGFLDLPFETSMLTASMRTADPSIAAVGSIVRNSEKWRSYFSPRTIHAMESTAGAFLAELGYAVSSKGCDQPSSLRWIYSKVRGRATAAANRIREHGVAALPVLLKAARVSRMQDSIDRSR
ncbi:MAG: sulfotransferase [Rubrivivax sp.]|nr:sulfotransferase [Rubrivivax sp.]